MRSRPHVGLEGLVALAAAGLGPHPPPLPDLLPLAELPAQWSPTILLTTSCLGRPRGRDELEALVMELPEAEALLRSFGLDNTRPRSALEEG